MSFRHFVESIDRRFATQAFHVDFHLGNLWELLRISSQHTPSTAERHTEQGTIAAMPRQRSVLLPEAHASNAFQPPTANPYSCALRAHPRSARFVVDCLLF